MRELRRRLGDATRYVATRFCEGSSMAAISAGVVNAVLVGGVTIDLESTAVPVSWLCLGFALLQVLLPDGLVRFERPSRRRRKRLPKPS